MHFTLTDLVTDITQNGAESGADVVELHISEVIDSSGKGEFRFTVKDNGKWMDKEELKLAQDPFVTDGVKHPHRKVGLGLPFLIQTAETSGGGWEMDSRKRTTLGTEDSGTVVSAWFDIANVDTPPVGDIPGMFRTVLLFEGPSEMVINRIREAPGACVD
jgi:nitrogen fixation/metabolism regulation signal transduction histidine kinase